MPGFNPAGFTETERLTGVLDAVPLVGLTDSQLPPVGEATLTLARNDRFPPVAETATVCAAGAGPPLTEPNVSAFVAAPVETVRLCPDVTVSFTITACGLLPAPAETMLICPV